jgi:hypothetical protein
MEVLVRLGCECEFHREDCPECRDKKSILRWLPLNLLPLLQRPYIVVDRRYVSMSHTGLPAIAAVC